MKSTKKVLAILLIACMSVASFSGCTNTKDTTSEKDNSSDDGKIHPVRIVLHVMQDVKNLTSIASMGALESIDEILEKYPDLVSKFTDVEWQGTLYNGKRYAVPCSWKPFDYALSNLVLRTDVMKKVGYETFPDKNVDDMIDLMKKSQDYILDESGVKAYHWIHQVQSPPTWLFKTLDTYPFMVESSLGLALIRQDGSVDSFYESEEFKQCANIYQKMYQDGLIGKLDCFSPGWNNSFKEDKFMFYNLAVSGIDWTVMANDPDGAGEWRVTRAPGKGYTYGGTSVSIYKDSKNKQGAWAFVKYIYTPGEGSEYSFETNALLPCFKSAYEDYSFYSEKGPFDDFFGGQNITKYYFDNLTDGLEGQVQTKHESTVQTALYKIVPIVYQDSNITADEAIKEIAKEIKKISPEVTID